MLIHNEIIEKDWDVTINNKTVEISKKFNEIPAHELVRIEANFHFVSCFWKGQAAFLQFNQEIIWIDHQEWPGFYNISREFHFFYKDDCEDEEQMWVSPINVIIRNDKKQFNLDFIVNGIEDISKTLFWIENINIYIK